MNRQGPGPPPLRGIPSFASQQPQARNAPLGSGRLHNGKLGSGSGWGFGVPNMAGAPGLPNPQSRPNSAAMTTFARSIGGSQPATPLDLTEFPSLSSAQPQQSQNSTQAAWANATQRSASHAAVHRPHQLSGNAPSAPSQMPLQQSSNQQGVPHQHQENPFASSAHFASGLEDFGFGGQGPVGQLTGSTQPKTGSIDEFPPLGRNANGEIGQARGGSMMPGAGFGAQLNGNGFGPSLSQPQGIHGRSGLLSSLTGQPESSRQLGLDGKDAAPMGLGSGAISATRSPVESLQQGQGDQDRNRPRELGQNGNALSAAYQTASQANAQAQASGQQNPYAAAQQSQAECQQSAFAEPPQASSTPESLQTMSEIDRFGLAGLLHVIRNEGSDIGSLAIGQDLTTLGLDLSQPDPLYPTFASPFADAGSRAVEPDFAVPACYTVQNIQPLDRKVASFSDETLFYVFYQMPRDVMQEVAAGELTNRNWRYHKELKQWLTKDTNFEPVRISPTEERGFYIFFDPILWQRQRREFLLQYDSLDSRPIQPVPSAMLP